MFSERPYIPRPGDWNCPQGCGLVFASKNACFRCGTPKPEGAGSEYGERWGSHVPPVINRSLFTIRPTRVVTPGVTRLVIPLRSFDVF
jgi:hypothetical protein